MGSGTFVEDFKQGLEFTPVEGRPNVYAIHPRRANGQHVAPEMTPEDWDKFERDVADALEQTP